MHTKKTEGNRTTNEACLFMHPDADKEAQNKLLSISLFSLITNGYPSSEVILDCGNLY